MLQATERTFWKVVHFFWGKSWDTGTNSANGNEGV